MSQVREKGPVANKGMQMDNKLFFLRRESSTFKIRPKIINPTKTTTLPTSLKPCIPSNVTPTTLSIAQHIPHQLLVLLRRPQPFPVFVLLHILFPVTRLRFPHFSLFSSFFPTGFGPCMENCIYMWCVCMCRERKIKREKNKIKRRLHGVVRVMMMEMVGDALVAWKIWGLNCE